MNKKQKQNLLNFFDQSPHVILDFIMCGHMASIEISGALVCVINSYILFLRTAHVTKYFLRVIQFAMWLKSMQNEQISNILSSKNTVINNDK